MAGGLCRVCNAEAACVEQAGYEAEAEAGRCLGW